MVFEVQQVDKGVIVQGQGLDNLVLDVVNVAEGLDVHVGELSDDKLDAALQVLLREERGLGFCVSAG